MGEIVEFPRGQRFGYCVTRKGLSATPLAGPFDSWADAHRALQRLARVHPHLEIRRLRVLR